MCLCTLVSCVKFGVSTSVVNLEKLDLEIPIRNWDMTRAYRLDQYEVEQIDSNINKLIIHDQGDNIRSYKEFGQVFGNVIGSNIPALEKASYDRFKYKMTGSYIQMDTLLNVKSDIPYFCYAASIINSEIDRDVALIAGASNGIQVWLNNEVVLSRYSLDNVNGYQYNMKARLKKGKNFLLVKLTRVKDDWKFFMKVASITYANDNSLGKNFSSFYENYLVRPHDSLRVKFASPYGNMERRLKISVFGPSGKALVQQNIRSIDNRAISFASYPHGPYKVLLQIGNKEFKQDIFYGDHRSYFHALRARMQSLDIEESMAKNVEALAERIEYLDTVAVKRDISYERKMAESLAKLNEIYLSLAEKKEPFAHLPGLHLRAQRDLERQADHYMVYIPKSYRSETPIPLVVMLPHTTGLRRFNISTYVSDIDRLEHIKKLAEKHHFAVVWSSYRVYNTVNISQSIANEIFKVVDEVKMDYNIDRKRIYAYGDCAGGAIGLFLAKNYPSYFAAVALEGPAISNPDLPNSTSRREVSYDLYSSPHNFINTPIFIIHSIYDEKAKFEYSQKFLDEVNAVGGQVSLKKLIVKKGNNAFYFFMNLMPDNKNLTDIFSFFDSRKLLVPDRLRFSTHELKYNRSFWLAVTGKFLEGKSDITAEVDRSNNSLSVNTVNVRSFEIDLSELRLNRRSGVKLLLNGSLLSEISHNVKTLRVKIGKNGHSRYSKTGHIEGPQNHFFDSPFMVVLGTKGGQDLRKSFNAGADTLIKYWVRDFLGDTCRIKRDIDITVEDIGRYNLCIIGNPHTNYLAAKIEKYLPMRITDKTIEIGENRYRGDRLSFTMIYPNPKNKNRYVLLAGSNSNIFDANLLKSIYFSGWYDFTISSSNRIIANWDFDRKWERR